MSQKKSTILNIQSALFTSVNPNIISTISEDQTTLIAVNINEEDFAKLKFPTNYPSNTNGYLYMSKLEVYLGDNLFPTPIFGLFDIVNQRIMQIDSLSYVLGERIYEPFKNGFQDGITIGELIDALSKLSRYTPDTFGIKKKFVITLDPGADAEN